MKTGSILLVTLLLVLGPLSNVFANGYTYTPSDYPGASHAQAHDINDAGTVVGMHRDTSGVQHGFLAVPVSQTSSFTLTPSGTGTGTITSSPSGINCGTACSASYDTTSQVTLNATPASVTKWITESHRTKPYNRRRWNLRWEEALG